ncbi:hypothetical protein [Micromonospora sp. IBHARD004]
MREVLGVVHGWADGVARRQGGTGRALRGLRGPIHRAPDRARQPAGSPR